MLALLVAAAFGLPASAQQPAAAPAKAQACAVCHGVAGLATVPETPNLAGQPESYLAAQLRDYRSGKRQHEVMTLMAKPLSDDDIRGLAGWYASQAVELKAR